MDPDLHRAFRTEAAGLDGVDLDAYRAHDRDPREPIIGLGDPACRIALFGRDPGRNEVIHQLPFIGAGGQKIRKVLHDHLHGDRPFDFEASVAVGRFVFWANTVPYKPLGNKAWSMKVKKRFQPLMARLLTESWQGTEVITLGREAFLWFGIGRAREARAGLAAFWSRNDRFTASLDWRLPGPGGRAVRLHPLPHPSPLNAAWFRAFDGLLADRLRALDLSVANALG